MSAPNLSSGKERYRMGDLLIDAPRERVTRDGRELALGKLTFDLLIALVRSAPDVVTFDTIMRQVWPGLVVTLETVSQRIKRLRSALGDDPKAPRYIGGVRGRGYRIIAPVTSWSEATPMTEPASESRPPGRPRVRRYALAATATALIILLCGAVIWLQTRSPAEPRLAIAARPSPSIAVMPFINLTGDPAKDYLGDGMAEEIINSLTRIQGLKVPARSSSFAYKARNVDIRQIAKDLGVSVVLEGSVRQAGSQIRITAQLVNAQDGLNLWSQTYERPFADIFKLQDDLAQGIVEALKVDLSGASFEGLRAAPSTSDVEAYDLYMQGSALEERSTPQSIGRALEYFQRALDRDPRFSRAYVGIASAKYLLAGPFGQQPIANLNAAEHAAQRALVLDPTSSGAEAHLAAVAQARGQWLSAEAHARAAISLSTGDASVHLARGAMLDNAGYLRGALDELNMAHDLAPASAPEALNLAIAYLLLGRDSDALRSAKVAADLGWDEHSLSFVYEQEALRAGRYAEATSAALANLNLANTDQRRTAEVVTLVYSAMADSSHKAVAMAARQRLYPIGLPSASRSIADARPCLQSGLMYAQLGELDVAYEIANQCLNSLAPGAITQGPLARMWTQEMRPFRQDLRFEALTARLGLLEYWQKYGPPDACDLKAGKLACH